MQLLCEKNAETIQEEEVVVDDGCSVAESAPDSEDPGSEFEAAPTLDVPRPFSVTSNQETFAQDNERNAFPQPAGQSGKKFAAPKPPTQVKQQVIFLFIIFSIKLASKNIVLIIL